LLPSPTLSPAHVSAHPLHDALPILVTDRPLHHRALHQIREEAAVLGGDGRRAEVLVVIDTGLEDEGTARAGLAAEPVLPPRTTLDRQSTRLNSSHVSHPYAGRCVKQ